MVTITQIDMKYEFMKSAWRMAESYKIYDKINHGNDKSKGSMIEVYQQIKLHFSLLYIKLIIIKNNFLSLYTYYFNLILVASPLHM